MREYTVAEAAAAKAVDAILDVVWAERHGSETNGPANRAAEALQLAIKEAIAEDRRTNR